MKDNYAKIFQDNLRRLYDNLPHDLAKNLPAEQEDDRYVFEAFGERCVIGPGGITIAGKEPISVVGILISLYALNAHPDICVTEPFRAFKEFPDSMPYVGAFTTHTEQLLVPYVPKIRESIKIITDKLKGGDAPDGTGGDFSFVVYPLPKVALCYIFYEADEDFPASVTCLYSHNARSFLPIDGLADVGEYCSKTILQLVK